MSSPSPECPGMLSFRVCLYMCDCIHVIIKVKGDNRRGNFDILCILIVDDLCVCLF